MITATAIPDLVTTMSSEQIVVGVGDGCDLVLGAPPLAITRAIVSAQVHLETGNGLHMHRYNPGNRKVREGDQYYTMFPCNEILGGKPQWFYPPHPQTWFVAFLTAKEGIGDYIKLLSCFPRYQAAWHKAYIGDSDGFVMELGRAGYFTANPVTYAKAVTAITQKLLPLCQADTDVLTDEERASVLQLVSETLAGETGTYQYHPDRWAA